MRLNKEDQKNLDEYLEEINSRKKLTEQEVEDLINSSKKDAYTSFRSLIQHHFYYAYEIAKTYKAKELTILDFIHAANEGLEIGVVSANYSNYDTFIKCIDTSIRSSIELMLSFLNN